MDPSTAPERKLKVLVWIDATPSVGVCTICSRRFRAALTATTGETLQAQFAEHKCVDLKSL